jgi:hypothetical protein
MFVRGVGERLDPGQDDARLVGDHGEPDGLAEVGQRLDQRDPAAAAGDDQPQLRVVVGVRLQQRRDLRLEAVTLERQLDRSRRALHPVQVRVEGEGPAAVEPDHLEDAVAAVEAVIGQADRGLVGRADRSVD